MLTLSHNEKAFRMKDFFWVFLNTQKKNSETNGKPKGKIQHSGGTIFKPLTSFFEATMTTS